MRGPGERSNLLRVLIVEDEMLIAMDLQATVAALGADLIGCVPSAEEALCTVTENPADVAIIDFRLAGDMDGIALAWEMKKRGAAIIMASASLTDPHIQGRVRQLEPHASLLKPYNGKHIRAVLRTVARERDRALAPRTHLPNE